MAKYLNPKSDLTFKKVFGEHKDLLISFLNALLPLQPGTEIVDLEYLKDEIVPTNPTKKDSVVDVRCKERAGRQFIVEMQMYWTDAFMKRALLNTCKAYSQPAERGMNYADLKPIYTLSLVNDIAFPELEEDFYHEYVPTNRNHTDHTIDDFDMIFIELPKFRPEKIRDKKMAVLWLRFLTEINEHTHEAPEELMSDSFVNKALSLLEESAYTDAELRAIDKYWDMVSREVTMVNSALSQGRAEGRAEGLAEGERKQALDTARQMKKDGLPLETIVKYTHLSEKDIAEL